MTIFLRIVAPHWKNRRAKPNQGIYSDSSAVLACLLGPISPRPRNQDLIRKGKLLEVQLRRMPAGTACPARLQLGAVDSSTGSCSPPVAACSPSASCPPVASCSPPVRDRALAVSAMLWLRVGSAEAKAVAKAGSCSASRVLIALTTSALTGFFDASAKAAASLAKAVVRANSVAAGSRPRYAVSLSA